MPPVAIIGALASAGLGTALGGTVLGLTAFQSFFVRFAVSFVLSEVGRALSPKPKSGPRLADESQQRTQQITQAIASDEWVGGAVMKSGSLAYASNTENNKYTHLVIIVADHEVAGLDEVMVNSDVVPNDYLDADGNVIHGKFCKVDADGEVTSYLRIRKFTGAAGQEADAMLMAEDANWTVDHRLQGRAGIYVRYERNQEVFATPPNFAVLVRGAKPYDPRIDIAAWTPNIALLADAWAQDKRLGSGIEDASRSTDATEAAANACEEMVATKPATAEVTRIDLSTVITSVSVATDELTLEKHDFIYRRAQAVQMTTSGTLPAGISAATNYYIIPRLRSDTEVKVKLAASAADAVAGVAVNITDAGSGTHRLVKASTDLLTLGNSTYAPFQHGDAVQASTTGTLPTGLSAVTDYYVIPYQYSGTPRIKLATSLANALANNGVGIAIELTGEGSGTITLTKTHEPRYFGGGIISSSKAGGEGLADILTGMAGRLGYSGGIYSLYAGVWRGPVDTLTADDLRAPLSVVTKTSRSQRFNSVIGNFISPANNWQGASYPLVRNATYLAEDMGEVFQGKLDLPFTQRASTAQRIAKIKLDLARQEQVVNCRAKMTALQFRALDTIYVDMDRTGWAGKHFEVQTWKLNPGESGGAPVPGIDMVLQETSSACYDWDDGKEIAVDPAPNTNLESAFAVDQVQGLSINSIAIGTKGGDTIYRAIATWEPVDNAYVVRGGKINFQYRLTGETEWNRLPAIPGDAVKADIFSGALGTGYDLQAWLENSVGLIGRVYQLSNLTLGTSGGVGTTNDWGSVADSVGTSNDWAGVADAVGTTNDWGGLA